MELSFGGVGLEDESRSPSSSALGDEDLFRSDVEADESATTSTSFSCPPEGGLLEVCLTGLLHSSLSWSPKGATPLHRSLRECAVGGGGEGNYGTSLVTN